MLFEARIYIKNNHILAVVSVIADDETVHQARFEVHQVDAALTWINNVLAIHAKNKLKLN